MRVYVAGPMTGLPEFNRPAFDARAASLRAAGHIAISPPEITDAVFGGDTTRPYAEYIAADLRELLTCEAISLLPGWHLSRGARMEEHVAAVLGLARVDADGRSP